jgi:hypothetical protein
VKVDGAALTTGLTMLVALDSLLVFFTPLGWHRR